MTCQSFCYMKIKIVLPPCHKKAVKSLLLDILKQGTNTTYEQPNTDTVIMDDTTLISAHSSRAAKRSDGYAPEVVVPHTESYVWKYFQYDVVFYIYIYITKIV